MALMTVIYRKPEDPEAFDEHYFATHVPLAKKSPGLRRYEVSRGPVTVPVGDFEVHFVATMQFDDLAAIRSALASPEGQAAAADRRQLAADDAVLILLCETREV